MSGNFLSCMNVVKDPLEIKREGGISLKMLQRKRASSSVEWRISWCFSSFFRKRGVLLKIRRGPHELACVATGKSSLHASCEGPLGILLQSVAGPRSSSGAEPRTSMFLSSVDKVSGFLWTFNRGVQSRLVWRHASRFSSRSVTVVSVFLRVDVGICGCLLRCHRAATRVIEL